jgi:hypothetical protein
VKQASGMWADDMAKMGLPALLRKRLAFHNALAVDDVVRCTGRSCQTVRKHMRRIVDDGHATWHPFGNHPQGGIRVKEQMREV